MTLEPFLNCPNRTQFENRENTEIPGNRAKSGRLQHSKYQNSANFQDIYLKFCTHTPDIVLSHVPVSVL